MIKLGTRMLVLFFSFFTSCKLTTGNSNQKVWGSSGEVNAGYITKLTPVVFDNPEDDSLYYCFYRADLPKNNQSLYGLTSSKSILRNFASISSANRIGLQQLSAAIRNYENTIRVSSTRISLHPVSAEAFAAAESRLVDAFEDIDFMLWLVDEGAQAALGLMFQAAIAAKGLKYADEIALLNRQLDQYYDEIADVSVTELTEWSTNLRRGDDLIDWENQITQLNDFKLDKNKFREYIRKTTNKTQGRKEDLVAYLERVEREVERRFTGLDDEIIAAQVNLTHQNRLLREAQEGLENNQKVGHFLAKEIQLKEAAIAQANRNLASIQHIIEPAHVVKLSVVKNIGFAVWDIFGPQYEDDRREDLLSEMSQELDSEELGDVKQWFDQLNSDFNNAALPTESMPEEAVFGEEFVGVLSEKLRGLLIESMDSQVRYNDAEKVEALIRELQSITSGDGYPYSHFECPEVPQAVIGNYTF